MGLDMVNRVERLMLNKGDCLSRNAANQQRARQPRCVGNANCIDIIPAATSLGKCLANYCGGDLYMATGSNLWHDTTVLGVNINL